MTRRFNGLLAGLLCGWSLTACGEGNPPGGGGPDAEGRSILRVAYNREIDVLNPFTSQNLVDIQFSMIEGLITTNDRNTYIPVLAREIPTLANGLITDNGDGTWDMTWRLHEGVRWHDGEPLTSEDVCFTWRFVASEGSQVYNREMYLGILRCSAPDEHTVVFTWDGLYGYYAGIFEAVLPEHVLGDLSTQEVVEYEPFNRGSETIGTGPFRFAEWEAGAYIRVVRNEDYWRGPDVPSIDEVVWSFIPDSNTRLNALLAGEHHYGQIDPVQVSRMETVEGYGVNLTSSNSVMHLDLSLNTERSGALFADRRVRLALFHAIDRPAIADQLMQGTVQIAHTPLNPTSPYHNPDVPVLAYDPATSQALLREAGWAPGPDGVLEKDGLRFSFEMINRAGAQDRIQVAQVIQAQLAEIGVEVTFQTLESAAWTSRWRQGNWEALVSAWYLPADPSLSGLYICDGPNNMTGFCHPELDELLLEADRHLELEPRKEALDRAQVALAEAAVSLPIYFNVIPEVVSDRVQNYRGSGTNLGSFWNLWEWTLVQ
ncbi:MAG: peptide ABC transporter substrate-binding protein [Gemmatimonadetes bacterium]|nr:peptide ABC transporter substrate-binding protein [Gemmatimonadota bacterium]